MLNLSKSPDEKYKDLIDNEEIADYTYDPSMKYQLVLVGEKPIKTNFIVDIVKDLFFSNKGVMRLAAAYFF